MGMPGHENSEFFQARLLNFHPTLTSGIADARLLDFNSSKVHCVAAFPGVSAKII